MALSLAVNSETRSHSKSKPDFPPIPNQIVFRSGELLGQEKTGKKKYEEHFHPL